MSISVLYKTLPQTQGVVHVGHSSMGEKRGPIMRDKHPSFYLQQPVFFLTLGISLIFVQITILKTI